MLVCNFEKKTKQNMYSFVIPETVYFGHHPAIKSMIILINYLLEYIYFTFILF